MGRTNQSRIDPAIYVRDMGVILKLEPERLIQYSHFSLLSGQQDLPENYHTVTIELSGKGKQTFVSLLQDNNATEEAREHSEKNWKIMLDIMETYGEVIENSEKVTEQLMGYLQKVPQYAKYFKISLDLNGHPNPEDVTHAAQERVMILLRLNI